LSQGKAAMAGKTGGDERVVNLSQTASSSNNT
jgi:hypothetical protein